MNRKSKMLLGTSFCLLGAFVLWTVLLCLVDVQAIGPRGSAVGFATLNRAVHRMTGVHMPLYHVTDWLGLVPVAVAAAFAVLGLVQWIGRKRFLAVDRSLLSLGVFYIAVIAVYLLFEEVVINYRPTLIEGVLEASYPSSTTVLALCVMPTAMMQMGRRIGKLTERRLLLGLAAAFTAFMVLARLFSGVHWISDIVGGVLVSGALVTAYAASFYWE